MDRRQITLNMEPRIVTPQEAADALGITLDNFKTNVQPDLTVITVGDQTRVSVSQLDQWVTAQETP